MKTNTGNEVWQITYNWLLLSGSKPNRKYCRQEITTHPDYPAITSITDFLETGNMGYNAVQADASYIHEFNYPLLAHIRRPGQEYMHIVSDVNAWGSEKEITTDWTGITLFPEKNAQWKNEQNTVYQNRENNDKKYSIVLILIGLGLFIAASYLFSTILLTSFGLLSFIGLVISVFLSGAELGYQNQVVKQVCGAVSNGGCEKVLNSRYAKGILGITPADTSLLYFGAQFIIFLMGSIYPHLLQSILFIAFAGVPIAAWSIYTQAVKLKQWCALCLAIAGVLILQTIITLFIITNSQIFISSLPLSFLVFTIIALLLMLTLLPIKRLIKTNYHNNQQLSELKKWKKDPNLFITQWEREQQVDTTIWQNDLLLGNPIAPVLITIACNPYCRPCAKAHFQLDDFLHRFVDKIKIQVRFLFTYEDQFDDLTIAVKAILQKASELRNKEELQQMISDWFQWMDFEKWDTKWQSRKNIDVAKRLKEHIDWIDQSSIQFTPTIFINGKKLPGKYSLKELEVLIPELAEILVKKQ